MSNKDYKESLKSENKLYEVEINNERSKKLKLEEEKRRKQLMKQLYHKRQISQVDEDGFVNYQRIQRTNIKLKD